MNLKRHEKDVVDVNLTPLIDVVFLLLIFFMVTTEFKDRSAFKVDPPEASPAPKKLVIKQALTVYIVPNGKIKLEIKKTKGREKPVLKVFDLQSNDLQGLKRAIRKLTGGNLKTQIYIQAASNSPFQSFVRAYDALQSLGLKKISIVTKQIKKKK